MLLKAKFKISQINGFIEIIFSGLLYTYRYD